MKRRFVKFFACGLAFISMPMRYLHFLGKFLDNKDLVKRDLKKACTRKKAKFIDDKVVIIAAKIMKIQN